jgi:tetratricopeptide (TPR) repeat protein
MVKLDERVAAKGGMPIRIPVPKEEIPHVETRGIERDKVVPWIERFVKSFPDSPQAAEFKGVLNKARLWAKAAALLKEGHWQQAGNALTDILKADPNDASAHFNMGAVCRNTGDLEGALDHYAKAEPIFNDEGIFFSNRGRTYQQMGKRVEAIADYHKALELMPGDEFTLQKLAEMGELVEVYGDPKDPKSRSFISRADYAKAVELDLRKNENDFDYLVAAAHRHALEDQSELSRNAAGMALKLNPSHPKPWLYMGIALWRLERYKDAHESMKRHLELDEKSAVGWTNMAKIQFDLGDKEGALGALWKALEIDPNQQDAIELLAGKNPQVVKAIIGKFPSSWAAYAVLSTLESSPLASLEKALSLGAPDDVLAAYLGELGKAGQSKRACQVAEGLKDLSTRSPEVRWNAALSYQGAGRKKEARKLLEALARDPNVHPQWRATAQSALRE